MGSCGKKSSRKSTSCGHRSRASFQAKGYSRKSSSCGHRSRTFVEAKAKGYSSAGRNPFFQYLAFYRKRNRKRLGHLPSCKVALLAGRRWTRMSPDQREPFISAANSFSYTYRPRSKKVNWVLGNLQEYLSGGECQAAALWKLMRSLKSWQQHCVLNDRTSEKNETEAG